MQADSSLSNAISISDDTLPSSPCNIYIYATRSCNVYSIIMLFCLGNLHILLFARPIYTFFACCWIRDAVASIIIIYIYIYIYVTVTSYFCTCLQAIHDCTSSLVILALLHGYWGGHARMDGGRRTRRALGQRLFQFMSSLFSATIRRSLGHYYSCQSRGFPSSPITSSL